MASLSVVITTYNEEKNIERAILSVKRIADEVIVIDGNSTDETQKKAKKLGATVVEKPNDRMLNKNKNSGFSRSTGDWVLSLDADEEIPGDLAKEIVDVINRDDGINGYWIARKNIIFGKWIQHGLWWPDKQLRLFRKDLGKFPCVHVHEYLAVEGKTDTLKAPFHHYNYTSVDQYLRKMISVYTDNEVEHQLAGGYKVDWQDAIRFPVSDFLKIYFAQQGYKDGLHGLVLAILQSFYSFIVFAKMWEKQSFVEVDVRLPHITKELDSVRKETQYWVKTARIHESDSPVKIFLLKIKRKLSIIR